MTGNQKRLAPHMAEAAPAHRQLAAMPARAAPVATSLARADVRVAAGNLAVQRALGDRLAQSQLPVSRLGDAHEREADAMAARAMAAPAIAAPAPLRTPGPLRQPSAEALPLAPGVQAFYGTRFRRDFSHVRTHAGQGAAAAAQALNARAFTVGQDIYFGADQLRLEQPEGRWLLAHELSHVVQQNGAATGVFRQAAEAGAPPDQAAQTPVLWGLDMSVRPQTVYVSVKAPGHSLAEVATYMYGSADAAASLRASNPGVADNLAPGQTLRPAQDRALSQSTSAAIEAGIEDGTILRSRGMPGRTEGADVALFPVPIGGSTQSYTAQQLEGMTRGVMIWMARKADYYHGRLEGNLEVRNSHERDTNSWVRGISDWLGDVSLPDTALWTDPMRVASEIAPSLLGALPSQDEGYLIRLAARSRVNALGQIEIANRLLDNPISPEVGRLISENLARLQTAATGLDKAQFEWHRYIEGTISGAQVAVNRLELTRNVAFGVAAGLAGAIAAPAAFAALTAGGTVSAGTATVLSLGAAAGSGGVLRGTLEVVAPGAQANRGVGDRFVSGFGSGAVQGLLGGAGSFATPAVSGVVAQGSARVFGQQFLTTTAGRITVNTATQGIVGAGSGAAGAALENAPALASGRITPGQYFSQIRTGTLWGGGLGAAFSFAPVSGFNRASGVPFVGRAVAPPPRWLLAGPFSPLQAAWNPPPGFNALRSDQLPALPEGLTWARVTVAGRAQWEPVSLFGPNRNPIELFRFGDAADPAMNYVVGDQNGVFYGRQTFRPANDTYQGLAANQGEGGTPLPGAPRSGRRDFPMLPQDFTDPVTGTRYTRGHITDYANTTDRTAAIPDSNLSPENFAPEQPWWGGLSGRNRLTARIRASNPAGGAQLVQYNVYPPTPRTTTNGTPIPDAFILVEINATGTPVRAWRVPNNTTTAPSPVNTAAAIDAGYAIPLAQVPQPVMNDLNAVARAIAAAGATPATGGTRSQ